MQTTDRAEIVGDPVGHISISGVHGRDELAARLKHAKRPKAADSGLGRILAGMLIGAAVMYILGPKRPQNGA